MAGFLNNLLSSLSPELDIHGLHNPDLSSTRHSLARNSFLDNNFVNNMQSPNNIFTMLLQGILQQQRETSPLVYNLEKQLNSQRARANSYFSTQNLFYAGQDRRFSYTDRVNSSSSYLS